MPDLTAKLSEGNRYIIRLAAFLHVVDKEGLLLKHISHGKLIVHYLVNVENIE